MRNSNSRLLLALIPTFLLLLTANILKSEISGLWYDHYTNTKLEIKHSRKGIKAKHLGGWFPKWRRYVQIDRGVFDDCEGRVIIALGYNKIKWQNGRYGRAIILSRYGHNYRHQNYDRYNRYDDYRGRTRYNEYRDTQRPYNTQRYYGDWFCEDRGLQLSIKSYNNGFRAYHNDEYSYYESYDDHFRDHKGNKYFFKDEYLIWQSHKGDRLRFKKR